MNEHTPGPWHYQEGADAYTHIVRGANGNLICQLAQDTTGRAEADARLIAAALVMFETLECIAVTTSNPETRELAQMAIAATRTAPVSTQAGQDR
jgi:hypothetical protein